MNRRQEDRNDSECQTDKNISFKATGDHEADAPNKRKETILSGSAGVGFRYCLISSVLAVVLITIGIVMGCRNDRDWFETVCVGGAALCFASIPKEGLEISKPAAFVAMAASILSFAAAVLIPKLFSDPPSVIETKIIVIVISVIALAMAIVKLWKASDRRR